MRCFCILVLIFVQYIRRVVQWVQYFNFGLESSLLCARQQWAYTADKTWLLDCFDVLWNEVEAVNDESASESIVYRCTNLKK